MINRALIFTILVAAGAVAVINSKAPAETTAQLQPAVCTLTGTLHRAAIADPHLADGETE